jgi:transposase-like protein
MTARTGPVVVQSERRRNWSDEQKLLIVQESLRPGVVVAQVARRWAIGSGQLYTWRKQNVAERVTFSADVNNLTDRKPFPTTTAFPVSGLGRFCFLGATVRY